MHSKPISWLACLALVAACGQAGPRPAAINIRLALHQGERFTYSISSVQEIEQQINRRKSSVRNSIALVYDFDVVQEIDSVISTAVRVSRIKFKTGDDDGGVNYDSEAPGTGTINTQLHAIFDNLRGHPFSAVFSRSGNVQQVNGLSELMKKVQASTPGMSAAGSTQTDENLHRFLSIYPPVPVKPGDTWTSRDTLQAQGLYMVAIKKYRVSRIENNILYLTVNTEYEDAPAPMQDPRVKVATDGSQEGTVEIDIPTGIIKKVKLTAEIDIRITGGGQSYPVTLKEETLIEGKVQ